MKDVHRFSTLVVRLEDCPNGAFMVHNNFESSLVVGVKCKQHIDTILMELKKMVLSKSKESFSRGGNGFLRYQGKLYVPNIHYLT